LAAGHPEGFFEAFANIYTEFAEAIHKKIKKKSEFTFPNIEDGLKAQILADAAATALATGQPQRIA
jgi:predicted dehydrogenase